MTNLTRAMLCACVVRQQRTHTTYAYDLDQLLTNSHTHTSIHTHTRIHMTAPSLDKLISAASAYRLVSMSALSTHCSSDRTTPRGSSSRLLSAVCARMCESTFVRGRNTTRPQTRDAQKHTRGYRQLRDRSRTINAEVTDSAECVTTDPHVITVKALNYRGQPAQHTNFHFVIVCVCARVMRLCVFCVARNAYTMNVVHRVGELCVISVTGCNTVNQPRTVHGQIAHCT